MATCEKIGQTPVPPPVEYQLTLSVDEATYLRALLGNHIIGTPEPRGVNTAIYDALCAASVPRRCLRVSHRAAFGGTPALRLEGWAE